MDKNGVYTLTNIKDTGFDADKDKVGQKAQTVASSKTVKIDKKNITLEGQGSFDVVYGKADSVYLTAELKKVHVKGGDYAVISGVDNVTTGVKNTSIELWNAETAGKDVDKDIDTADWDGISSGVYTLFKDNGYVIAAVVVGDDAAATKNLVYAHKKSVELESYDKAEDEWTWSLKAVDAKGQEITLTEKSDSLSELSKMTGKTNQYTWYQVKYDAKGNVTAVEPASSALKGYERIVKFGDIQTAIDKEDTVLLEAGTVKTMLSLKGSTLYSMTDKTRGVVIDDDTNIVFIQTNNNKETTSFETGVKALETALKNLNEVKTDVYNYEFSAIIEDGIATTVVIHDNQPDSYTGNTGSTNADLSVSVKNGVDALSDLGYTDVNVKIKAGAINGVVGTKNAITYEFTYNRVIK